MDISEIRRENLQRLITEAGSRQSFIDRTGKSDGQISQLLTSSKNSRNIGSRLAREFEQLMGKEPGWMDYPHRFNVFELAQRKKAEYVREQTGQYDIPDKDAADLFDEQYHASNTVPFKFLAESDLEMAGQMDAWDSDTPLTADEVELPLFREVELAAGSGATQVVENHGAKLRFARSTLKKAGVPPENAACAYVRGNSMEPMMPDGATIGVNTADTEIRDGKIYAIDHDGMLRVKILHRRPGGGLKVVSLNSVEHPPEDYSPEYVAQNIRVKGRVFWFSGLI